MRDLDPNALSQLRARLARPQPSQDLAQRLHADIDRQADTEAHRGRWRLGAVGVAAAALLASVLLPLRPAPAVPPFVQHALQHTVDERGLHGLLDSAFTSWRAQAGVHLPGRGVELQLVKHCQVDGHFLRHLRLTSQATGAVEVLIGTSRIDAWPAPGAGQRIQQRRWLSLAPREGLALLVFYPADASESAVRRLVRSLLSTPPRDTALRLVRGPSLEVVTVS